MLVRLVPRASAGKWERKGRRVLPARTVAMVVTAEPSIGIPADTAMLLDLKEGSCNGCRLVSREEAENASFVIVASYARWKEVIRKQLDPTKGMMQNKLKLTKGHMPTIVKFVTASKELVESTSRVPTQFLDEPGA